MNPFRSFCLLLLLLLLPALSWAGGGPLNVLVVVNANSRDSRTLGAYYMEKHGIPEDNLCTVKVNPRVSSITLAEFERDVRLPILAHIANNGLAGQIHYLVLCMDIPSRVENNNGITSVLFYGYKTPTPGGPQCHVASNSVNQYYGAEIAYTATAGWNKTHTPIPFLLTAANLETAKKIVDRGVASIGAFPDGTFCLYGTGDTARNIRHRTYPAVARQFELFGRAASLEVHPTESPHPKRPILGYLTGRAYLPTNWADVVFAPGAIADHLTSCAGMIPDPCVNQSSVWDWMRLGATASYGTVSEPCAFDVKFPDPMVQFWSMRGFTAGEALAMSVRNPYQGIWVGDPLAAPFAAAPAVRVLEPASDAHLDGEIMLHLELTAHENGAPPVFLDLYIDGRHHAPMARPFTPMGNEIILTMGTESFKYVVAPGEDLVATAAGLAWAINSKGAGKISASSKADRVEISVREPVDADGLPLSVAVETAQGFAPGLYLGAKMGTNRLVLGDGVGRAAVTLHLGHARAYEIEYPLDLAGIESGRHILSFVVRDGTAMQCQSQFELPLTIPPRAGEPAPKKK